MKKDLLGLFKYSIIGFLAFLIDTSVFAFFSEKFALNYFLATTISFTIAFIFNYFVSTFVVFKAKFSVKDFFKVAIIAVIGLLLTNLLVFVMIDIFHINKYISKVTVSAIVTIWNYLARKFLVYKL